MKFTDARLSSVNVNCADSQMSSGTNNTRKYSMIKAINKELLGQFIPSFITNTISFG